MRKVTALFEHNSFLYFFALITSVLLSLSVDYRESVVNPDGICYLLSAQLVGTSSIKEVMQFCPQSQWPLYSILIYLLVQISHLSYAASAYVLNSFFSLLSVIAFILIIKELGGSRRVLWLAALVILFDHQFNILRENIIRDHGFWAFYLSSILFFLYYFRKPTWTTGVAWYTSLIIATLFRIEGAIFLIVMPFLTLVNFSVSSKERIKSFLILTSPMILLCMAFITWQLFHAQLGLEKLGRISEIINQLQNGFVILADRYHTSKTALVQHVLPPEGAADATVVLFLVWISWYALNVCITLSWGYAALVAYAWKNKVASLSARSTLVIGGYLSVNAIVTLVFLAEHLFISKRYLIALTLTLMLWVPFALNDLIQKWHSKYHRIFLSLIASIIFISALSGIIEFGHSKSYIRSAGNWAAKNIPVDATIYVNDLQLMYYTQHFGTHIFKILPDYLQANAITQGRWKQYDYLALRLKNKEEGAMAGILQELKELEPIQIFSNKRGNHISIYKIK
ncbi:MAG: phospholipid carrier-dependent glycosyltransferase [Gammaproteobacteria bacterium]|nr:phospholipid carrier-dependent glycosyltransferase [Gammaproteobacteria bacterium]MCW5582999.1 phospholipid carrier-dependent glycosyltransferase [Gammaproteobacteria bacterium]